MVVHTFPDAVIPVFINRYYLLCLVLGILNGSAVSNINLHCSYETTVLLVTFLPLYSKIT